MVVDCYRATNIWQWLHLAFELTLVKEGVEFRESAL